MCDTGSVRWPIKPVSVGVGLTEHFPFRTMLLCYPTALAMAATDCNVFNGTVLNTYRRRIIETKTGLRNTRPVE
jgi:hypothetical protein